MFKHMTAALMIDAYKAFHKHAYNPTVTHVYSNFTNRHGKHSNTKLNKVVFFGLQRFIKMVIIRAWKETFFDLPKEQAVGEYRRVISAMLGKPVDVSHMEKLHDLGYLPIKIKALPEGSVVPYGVPVLTITNTVSGFGWVTNMLETVMSSELWGVSTSATTAYAYKKRFLQEESLKLMGTFVNFLGHDFSYRGINTTAGAAASGLGHLTSFWGSDTIPAALEAEEFYGAKIDEEMVFASVDATEHSVMCSYGAEKELESLRHLIKNVTPTGIISIVSDSWDFWQLVSDYLPRLKRHIMNRDGTVVIRPDSGDPVRILCGYQQGEEIPADASHFEIKGLIECLWDTFGGTVQPETGLRLLDSHIGAIYGDSITLERQDEIIKRLTYKGFVPSVVLGIGSFTYQYVTRDTHGSAVKATDVQMGEGNHMPIFKDPKTDRSKKSARGLLAVYKEGDEYILRDNVSPEEEQMGELVTVYENGVLLVETTLNEVRARIDETLY